MFKLGVKNVLNNFVKMDLVRLQSMPLKDKVDFTKLLIREFYEYFNGNVTVSFSGGKDSTILLTIAREFYPNISAVFFDTGLEYPEVREQVKLFDNVTWIKPKKNFRQIILDYGYPVINKEVSEKIYEVRNSKSKDLIALRLQGIKKDGSYVRNSKIPNKYLYLLDAPFKISSKCCYHMKKSLAKKYYKDTGNHLILATMTDESSLRFLSWAKYGCNAFSLHIPVSRPLSFWTEQDVLKYAKINNVSIAKVYGEIIEENGILKCSGISRTGCMFCMFGLQSELSPNRFERMKLTHPKQYEWCMKDVELGGLGLDNVLNYIGLNH